MNQTAPRRHVVVSDQNEVMTLVRNMNAIGAMENHFVNTVSAASNDIKSSSDLRANNYHLQFNCVMPAMVSLMSWCLTGNSYAPSNPYVYEQDHGQNPGNVSFNDASFVGLLPDIDDAVRKLFTYKKVSEIAKQAARPANYEHEFIKYMAIIDYNDEGMTCTYIIKLTWNRRISADDIGVHITKFSCAPYVAQFDEDALIAELEALGL